MLLTRKSFYDIFYKKIGVFDKKQQIFHFKSAIIFTRISKNVLKIQKKWGQYNEQKK